MSNRERGIATRHARRCAPALLLTLLAAPAFGQGDPTTTGPHAVTTVEYTKGDTFFTPVGFPGPVEFTAVVHYPTDLTSGPYPLVLYLHGRHGVCSISFTWPCPAGQSIIPSYQGYQYSGTQLASNGYIVISISANGINAADNGTADLGAAARAELIDLHLEYWRTLNTVGDTPFGTLFVGHVDLTRVGTMGHSRGGDGVMRHFSYNAAKPAPFPLKMIVPIAPTDFSRWQVNQNVAVAQFLPYCDGDVSDLQGVHYYDDARYLMTGTGYQNYITVMGANHNFFNSVWTPPNVGASDDWGITSDPHCGTGLGNGRLTAAQQRAVGLAYLATFFRTQVGGESGFFGYIDGSAGKPPTVSTLNLHASYQGNNSQRRDINRLLTAADLTTNFLGGATSQTGLSPHDLCGGALPQPLHCLTAQSTSRQPHTTPSARSSMRGMSSLRTGWSAPAATYLNAIPAGPSRDVSTFSFLQFRATVNFTDGRNPGGTPQDLSVRLTDGFGGSQTLRVGLFSGALFYPPGTQSAVPKILQNTVRIPLASFTSVNLTNVSEVAMLFDQQPSGALLMSDLHFYIPGGVPPPGNGFFPLTPCRVVDTRSAGMPLLANTTRTFTVAGACLVPIDAVAIAVNMTAVNPGELGDLRLYPTGQPVPLVSAINFAAGKTRANNAIVTLGTAGAIDVQCDMAVGSTSSTHFVLDVTGYFK
jgi:hypothetical protein